MARRIAYAGAKFRIAFAREKNSSCPGCKFFDDLNKLDQAKLMALFQIAGDHGKFYNPEKFGELGDGLFEFKAHQIRMPFAYAKKRARADSNHAWFYQEEGQDVQGRN